MGCVVFYPKCFSYLFKRSFLLLIGERLFVSNNKTTSLQWLDTLYYFVLNGDISPARVCFQRIFYFGLISFRMNNCTSDVYFVFCKIKIFPSQPKHFLHTHARVSKKSCHSSFSFR